MTHFPLLSRPTLWGPARHARLSCDKCKGLERKKGLEKPVYSILCTNEIEINLFESAQNLNQPRGEFIQVCCLASLDPVAPPSAPAPRGRDRVPRLTWSLTRPSPRVNPAAEVLRPESRPRARAEEQGGSRDSGTHPEIPDVTHLPAEVEVEFSNQEPVPVAGEARSAAAVRRCHVA